MLFRLSFSIWVNVCLIQGYLKSKSGLIKNNELNLIILL